MAKHAQFSGGGAEALGLSNVQIGLIGQMEFIKLGTMGSKGALDYASPYADDDRRDHEIHRRGRFGPELAVQTKVKTTLHKIWRQQQLHVTFAVPARRVVSSAMYWYFFAHLDRRAMRFINPCFLVPSAVVHRRCTSRSRRTTRVFAFVASVSPHSHDCWVRYRVETKDIGRRLLQILAELQRTRAAADPSARLARVPGQLVVRRRMGTRR
jgi:hypothetical protein